MTPAVTPVSATLEADLRPERLQVAEVGMWFAPPDVDENTDENLVHNTDQ